MRHPIHVARPPQHLSDPFYAFIRLPDPSGADAQLASLLLAWRRQIHQLATAPVDLTCEDVVPVFSTFNQLKAAGVSFDPALCVLMKKLQEQALNTPDDPDQDYEYDEHDDKHEC